MWEDVTMVLCGVGFGATVALVLAELPAVLRPGSGPHRAWRRH
jgi:hypothetical protein